MDIKEKEEEESEKHVKPVNETHHKYWIGGFALLSLACLALFFLMELHVFELLGTYRTLLKKLSLATSISFLVLAFARFMEMIVLKRTHIRSLRYNLVRLFRLLSVLIIIMVVISFLFQNWYTAAVSLGLISLILGFALQTPISSFIGWLYIILRNPYHVGDRIQITTFKGDVVEINYLDTTLWEFAGDYLTNDLPSGRLIRFPNSLVLQSAVFNYSWVKFPYIWNEIPFHIAYESDFEYVESTLKRVTKNELGPDIENKILGLKELVEQTPVDELEIKEYPFVCFRINANTWVEASVTYLVEPKQAASIRSRIIKNVIGELLKEPDKVMFPKSNAR